MAECDSRCGEASPFGETADNAGLPGPVIDSEALLTGRKEIFIRHEGELYRLRRTSRGKLIMTK